MSGNFAVSPITVTAVLNQVITLQFTGADAAGGSTIATDTGTLSKVQCEEGADATTFEGEDYGITLFKCQRYYEQSEVLTGVKGMPQGVAVNVINATGFAFLTPKRVVPTVVLYSRNGTLGKVSSLGTGSDTAGATAALASSIYHVHRLQEGSSGFTAGQAYEAHYTADAEL